MVYSYPILPSIYIPGKKQESSKPVNTEKLGTGEAPVCSWAMPQITKATATECGTQTQKKVSETRDVVFLNRMFFRTPMMPVNKTQSTDNEDRNSFQQDKRERIITVDFVTGDNDTATVESVDSSVPDTPMVNNNQGQSNYGCTCRRTMHYDPTTGHTIGTEATALANYYQCLKDTDGKMEFTNVGAGIGVRFENTMELKPMKYNEAINGPDG
jgi:hypothetical protein